MRRLKVPSVILEHDRPAKELMEEIDRIKQAVKALHSPQPDVSIIIPAFNEAENILKTLSSLSRAKTGKTVEIIVVNNNSADSTRDYALAAGVICVDEPEQGITPARNCGLSHAKGRYILNADADTIYPALWIDLMLEPLHEPTIAMVYGDHYFLPPKKSGRLFYFLYEAATLLVRWMNRRFREEAVNVFGFNSAFRKADAVLVEGFDHPPGTNEDGWLAVKLRQKTGKKLFHQKQPAAVVWTSSRRIEADGGLIKAALKRLRRLLSTRGKTEPHVESS